MGDPADSLARLMQSRGSDFFRNNDDGQATERTFDSRVAAQERQSQGRSAVLKEGMCGRYAPMRAAHIHSGGGLLRKQVYPIMPSVALGFDDTAANIMASRGCETAAPVSSIHVGFGRYVPYTQVASVTSGAWAFIPVFGGLRVAIHRGSPMARSMGARGLQTAANLVSRTPAKYGYILQNDTYVPARLSPGDRYLLTTSTF